MENLTSIAEHSDWLEQKYEKSDTKWHWHQARVEFGKQKLELWMFVPCKLVDGVWVVLEEPQIFIDIRLEEYQQAKERCLFEGFGINEFGNRIINNKDETIYVKGFNSKSKNWIKNIQENTIEDLVKYKPLLTATAQKGIGL